MQQHSRWAMSPYTPDGSRKYLNADERDRFIRAANTASTSTRSLCLTLAFTGCRISEALALRPCDIQYQSKVLSIKTLKKRGTLKVREVPVPDALLETLNVQSCDVPTSKERLWHWGRTTAWSRVKSVMEDAGICGTYASPKGLRHGFGIHAVQSNVPLHMVQRWLGHAAMSTTAIYADAVGPEERAIAQRMW
jgi:integrase/recombinase XerD